ncbi:MAG: hypothetical protein P1U87_00125 [Verrucomicrobiales bacterium]|nr:hypothetical protein [Verrucomicrobiales bacterium]
MKRFFLFLAAALSFVHTDAFCEEQAGERVLSLESIQEVKRDGRVAIENNFTVLVEGDKIQRGPVLNFLAVFHGPAGLVLKKRIDDIELFRNGEPEPFKEVIGEGTYKIYCGEKSVRLDPGVHEYTFRCVIDGEWVFKNGEAIGAFDVSGPFQTLPIDSARLILRFPDEVQLSRFSPAVHRSAAKDTGYTAKQGGTEILVSTTGALLPGHSFVVHAIWPSAGFAKQSQWIEVIKQHPRIPITVVAAIALVWAFVLLLARFRNNYRTRLATA